MIEVIVTVLWIAYGCFSAYQLSEVEDNHNVLWYIIFSIFSPLVLIVRVLVGIFSRCVW